MADHDPPPPSTVYLLKKYMLLLATLVATVTYGAGLNLPGGSWLEDTAEGQLAGDSILRHTNFRRYIVFYYFNAISFAASLLVGFLLLVMQRDASFPYLILMWTVMVVDMLGLVGAYAAGISHDGFTTACASVLVSGGAAYCAFVFACYVNKHRHHLLPSLGQKTPPPSTSPAGAGSTSNDGAQTPPTPTPKHETLLVLAIFAATGAYLAGLNPPGGFWRSTEEGHHAAGDPVLERLHPNRYRAFFFCNTTAFVTSLLAIKLTLDYETFDLDQMTRKVIVLYGLIITSLAGLGGAYAAGSCRDGKHTGLVVSLVGLVVFCVCVVHALHRIISINIKKRLKTEPNFISAIRKAWNADVVPPKVYGKLPEYIQLLATLGATITYLAGLDPPGGVWASSDEGHSVGDPILLTTNPVRYKFFFYFNSAAFVASLVIVVMLQTTNLVRRGHALLVALILDFFGLIGAYAAGSCRDTNTTIYTVAMAGAVLIYVVIHIVFFTLDNGDYNENELEKKRELLLLLAILAATLAYQVGLTPPGGLWEDNDKFGHRAGFPVLQDKYHRRYKAFFYCNAASFMASAALIVLLLNQNMYKPGIRCYALYVCMVAGMFGLVGAYAAGSSMHLKTSIIFLVSVGVGFGIATYMAVVRCHQHLTKLKSLKDDGGKNGESSKAEHKVSKNMEEGQHHENEQSTENDQHKDESMASYLMLVAILAASVTYLAGLKPPGGMWREDGNGHSAGNPVLHDIDKRRYNVFFYSNSASFVASIIVIALLLSWMMLPTKVEKFIMSLLRTSRPPLVAIVHTAIVLDVLALLVAYAAGTSRESRRSWKVILLFPIEIFVVFLFCFISLLRKAYCPKQEARQPKTQTQTPL